MANQSGKTTSSVNFRSAPEVRPDTILRGLAANVPVEVTSEQGEWYTVIVGGQNGFIKKDLFCSPHKVSPTVFWSTACLSSPVFRLDLRQMIV